MSSENTTIMTSVNSTATSELPESLDITVIDIVLCLVAVLLAVFICTGNFMTISVIRRTPALRTLPNIYIASLAVADFVVGLTMILLALFLLPTTRLHVFYRHINLCVLMQGMNIGMTAVSAIHMAFIAVDRYLYIAKPYFYQRVVKIKIVASAICFAWIFGIVYSLLPQFIHNPYGEKPLCDITETLPIGYLFYASTAIYWTLVAIIVVMYALVLHMAYKQRNAIQAAAPNGVDVKGKAIALRKKTMKSIRFFLTVFGVFFVCLTPVLICMGLDFYINVPADLYRFLNILALTNSGMNFIIYGVLNKDFRHAFYKMLRIKTPEQQHSSSQDVFTLTPSTAIDYT